MKEQYVQKQISDYLESQGYWVVKTISTNRNGTPDLLCCSPNGRFVAIEVKAPGKLSTVSKLQHYQINRINETGGLAFAADSLEKVKEVLLSR